MKIKKNRTYAAIFISDVHYLLDYKVRGHNHKRLFKLLDLFSRRNIKFKSVFLVGDIIENWHFNAVKKLKKRPKRFNKFFDRLDELAAEGGEKFYIVGNHDTTSFSMKLPGQISDYLEARKWQVKKVYEDDKMVVAHGHQGQYNLVSWSFAILVVRFLTWCARFSLSFYKKAESFYHRHLNHEEHGSPEFKIRFYHRLSKTIDQGKRLLICGHTHDFSAYEDLKIINTGNWVSDTSFVIQNKNRFSGFRALKKKQFEEAFTLKI